jgi:broad specificity phosphatase PhoE
VTELVLVRHGETIWHAENRYAGSSDVPLTPHGVKQAERLADWARAADLEALWCSPLSRAWETAQRVAEATGLAPRVDSRLRELHFGEGEGLTAAEMEQRFPERLAAFREDPVTHHLPGGEDPRSAVERAIAGLEDITRAVPAGRVLVVAHTTLIRLCLCQLLGIPLSDYRRVFPFLRNAGLNVVRLVNGQASLLQFNTPIEIVLTTAAQSAVTQAHAPE